MKNYVWIAVYSTSLIFSALLQPLGIYLALSAPRAQSFQITKGVIVDLDRGVVYLMNRERGIDAVELASGKLIWRSTSAAEPLLLFDNRLAAQAEAFAGSRVLPIVVMNTAAHGALLMSTTVPLPPPAFASIDDAMGSSFATDASLYSGELEVYWRFTQQAGLARPGPTPPEISGAARIDLETARAQVLPAGSALKKPRTSPPSGAPANIRLEPGFNFIMASTDGHTILANKSAGIDATGWTDYLWAIYSLQTGERLGEIRMHTSAAPFFVWKTMLVYVSRPYGRRVNGNWIEEPLELRAVDLMKTGREAWKTPIRDTAYHGPLPSRP